MNDAPTPESLWQQYDALAENPVAQSRFAREHEHYLLTNPRPVTAERSPNLNDGQARVAALRPSNPTADETANHVASALAWSRRF